MSTESLVLPGTAAPQAAHGNSRWRQALRRWRPSGLTAWVFAGFGMVLPVLVAYCLIQAPMIGMVALTVVLTLAMAWWALSAVAPSAPWYVRVALAVFLGQFVLNIGFSNVVVGAGAAKVTVAELSVGLVLPFLVVKGWPLLKPLSYFWVAILAILIPGGYHLWSDVPAYKTAALRDFLSVADLVYFIAGMGVCAVGMLAGKWDQWRFRFVRVWLIAGLLYSFTWPFATWLMQVSPKFHSYQQSIPLLGAHMTTPVNVLAAAAALITVPHLLAASPIARRVLATLAVLGTVLMLAMLQSRNLYLIAMTMPFLLAFMGFRKAIKASVLAVVVLIFSLGMMEAYEFRIPGRISDVSLSAVGDRLLSITGKHGDHTGAAGVNQRRIWWTSSLNKWTSSPETVVFGIGYGLPLTNFKGPSTDGSEEGVIVREPHNSYISSLSRGGLVYFTLWGYIVLGAFWSALRLAKREALMPGVPNPMRAWSAWVALVLFTLLLQAGSEPQFEVPSTAALFYAVAGFFVVEASVLMRNVAEARAQAMAKLWASPTPEAQHA